MEGDDGHNVRRSSERWTWGKVKACLQTRTDAPFITVTEGMKPFRSGFADMSSLPDHTTVSGTDVGCVDLDMGDFGQMEECDWVAGEEGFRVELQWAEANKITDEMHNEAINIIQSMITAPTHP